jgi:hypothetical protein
VLKREEIGVSDPGSSCVGLMAQSPMSNPRHGREWRGHRTQASGGVNPSAVGPTADQKA